MCIKCFTTLCSTKQIDVFVANKYASKGKMLLQATVTELLETY